MDTACFLNCQYYIMLITVSAFSVPASVAFACSGFIGSRDLFPLFVTCVAGAELWRMSGV